jgi:hypothetical protein
MVMAELVVIYSAKLAVVQMVERQITGGLVNN